MENREKVVIKENNLANWILKNPIAWEKICGLRYVTIKEMKSLMKTLEQNGFLELSDLMATRLYATMTDLEDNEPKY